MKKIIAVLVITISCLTVAYSQDTGGKKGFEKGNMYHLIGLGGQNYWRIGDGGYWGGYGYGGRLGRLGGFGTNLTIQYQGEWGIHDYIGLGFHTGVTAGGFRGATRLYIPIGIQGNFHFYQLIDDKTSKDIKSDKLDIYAGLNFGGGPAFRPSTSDVFGGIHGGAQVGARFYPSSNFGIFAELGYGKSFAQFGIVIR